MSHVTCKRVVITIFLLLVCLDAPQAHSQTGVLDDKSDKILNQFMGHVNPAQRLSLQVTQTTITQQQGVEHYSAEVYDVAIARPQRLAMVRTSGSLGPTIVCDGKKAHTYLPILQQYTTEDAPSSIDGLFNSSQAGRTLNITIPMLNLVVSKDFLPVFMQEIIWGQYIGAEKIDDVLCHHISLIQNDLSWGIWITQGEKPLIRKIAPDLTQYFRQLARTSAGPIPEKKIAWHFRHWQLDPKPRDEIFSFAPPPGATAVTQFVPRENSAGTHHLVGKVAPDFTVDLLDGGQLKLSQHKGKHVVILDFWAVRCPPCRAALPILQRIGEKYRDKGVRVYAVNVEDQSSSIRYFTQQLGLKLPIGLDSQSRAARLYDVTGIPQTVIVGKDGKIAGVHIGLSMDSERTLSHKIEQLLVDKKDSPRPDLTCKKLAFSPNPIKAGDKVTFTCTLANSADVPADKNSYDIKLFIDDDIEVYHGIGANIVPAAGEITFSISPQTWNFQVAAPGTHRYRLVVDPGAYLPELNETNNVLEGTFQVNK